jgi:hypothetical protein
MGIKKVGPMTEIVPGQWICIEPLLRDHVCSRPIEVVRRSGKRVYFLNRHGEDEGRFCTVGSIVALCDSKQEADSVYAVSQSQFDALNAVRAAHAAQMAEKFKA